MRIALPLLLALLPLTACAPRLAAVAPGTAVEVMPPPETPLEWREVASRSDAERLASLPARYAAALDAKASAALRADAGKGWPEPTPGVYDCRITRLGPRATVFRAFACYVGDDGDFLTLTKGTGTERPGGRLWRDTSDRMVFLGGVPVEGGSAPKPYGEDPVTDRIGVLERIGDFRWRLILDAPRPGVEFDVLELTPAPALLAAR